MVTAMRPDEYVTEDAILVAIDQIREAHGACTLQALAEALDRGKGTMATRVRGLEAKGLVVKSHLPGSIRRVRSP